MRDTTYFFNLITQGRTHEVRLLYLDDRKPTSFYPKSSEELNSILDSSLIDESVNCYLGLNPTVPPKMYDRLRGQASSNHHIKGLKNILIDIDAKRPTSKAPSTDSESQAAIDVAWSIWSYLIETGAEPTLLALSGNGAMIIAPCDLLPSQSHYIQGYLGFLANKFDTPFARVDQSTHDPARICRIIGTQNHKDLANVGDQYSRDSYIIETRQHVNS